MYISDELISDLKRNRVIPFIGAGMSMNLGLPSWSELISRMAIELEFDPAEFQAYGDFLELAEFYESKKGSIGPLRSWMDVNFHNPSVRIEDSVIHKIIANFNFHIIYTTNYDRWLEKAFEYYKRDYIKMTGIYDLTKPTSGKTQIIKFHGDFDDDTSIVLTESSYFNRLGFEGPLDMKLRSDILGRSLLFIGYSLNDLDIRYLLYKLNKLWEGYSNESVRPRSYIFMLSYNPVKNEVFRKRGIETICSDIENPKEALEDFLLRLYTEVHGEPPS